jgi:hypothetical protein
VHDKDERRRSRVLEYVQIGDAAQDAVKKEHGSKVAKVKRQKNVQISVTAGPV